MYSHINVIRIMSTAIPTFAGALESIAVTLAS